MGVRRDARRRLLGEWGERRAAAYLRTRGFAILRAGYRCPRGEVDLVCRDGSWLVFVEVKTRASTRAGFPEEAISARKRARLARVAAQFRREHGLLAVPYRFDVVAVDGAPARGRATARVRHYRNAFAADPA